MTVSALVTPAAPAVAEGDRAIPLLEGFVMGVRSATTGYKWLEKSDFPRPFFIGRRRFFLQSELLAHLSHLAAQRDCTGAPP